MKVISANRGDVRTITWRGKKVQTGIFKYPVSEPIYLGTEDVVNDAVVDRKHHGGVDMAVYAYSSDHYAFWKPLFPNSDWDLGMFGENLTVEGLNEKELRIGSVYQVGEAQVEVCQPRQPCFKLGIRFNTQSVLKKFINSSYSGVYFRVVKPGSVAVGDEFQLLSEQIDSPTIAEVYLLMYFKQANEQLVDKAINCIHLPIGIRELIRETQAAS
ncbi:MAG: MOSC domain-containing protein [Flavobacteriales bacterium]|nr:MOSC domain-containing protein [Flavobacteriales bacterium]